MRLIPSPCRPLTIGSPRPPMKFWLNLPAEDRMILSAYYLDGRTLAEIARMLGVHESTISRKLDKLAKSLRKQIVAALGRAMACRGARPKRPWRSMCAICRWIFAAAWRKRRRLRRSQRREWRPGFARAKVR